MQLWTDYEGVIIDGAYPLQKLLMPEGRSAFYSTAGPNGEPTVVRLIECHFDEEEILSRWRCVAALNHPNFLKFVHFGQTEIDGRPVVYAVLEKVDANLAEVLDQGTLSAKEVTQLASSLVAALDVLHTSGFIHEHVEPANIFALNDVVKLRSDCIREAPEGDEGRAAKQRDVHDLAQVLLRALTQRQSVEGVPDSAMPAPLGRIIRKGIDGTWDLENIKAALEGQFAPKKATAPNWASETAAIPSIPEQKTAIAKPVAAAKPPVEPDAQLPLPLPEDETSPTFTRATAGRETWIEEEQASLRARWLRIVGLVAGLVILFAWVIAHGMKAHRPQATAPAVITQTAQPAAAAPAPASTTVASPAIEPPNANVKSDLRSGWRVVAFTYNRRVDAEEKAAAIERRHRQLAPSVFSIGGHAPYFVSIGGVMDQHTAVALARRSRALGLPRDTFARNYGR